MEVSEMTKKLGDISRIMSDGFHFTKMRMLIEGLEVKEINGSATQVELDLLRMVRQFYNLCKYVESNPIIKL